MLRNFVLIAIGGMLGTVMRFFVSVVLRAGAFPFATLLVNILGCFIIGLVFGVAIKNIHFDTHYRLFLATGFCGGFTTFSAFSIELVQLLQQQRYSVFIFYFLVSVVGGLLATFAGLWLTK